jgi:hypothetical protein
MQRFARGPIVLVSGEGHGQILAAVRAVLADAKPHSAADICTGGIARGLLLPTTIPAYVSTGSQRCLTANAIAVKSPKFVILPNGQFRFTVSARKPGDALNARPAVLQSPVGARGRLIP